MATALENFSQSWCWALCRISLSRLSCSLKFASVFYILLQGCLLRSPSCYVAARFKEERRERYLSFSFAPLPFCWISRRRPQKNTKLQLNINKITSIRLRSSVCVLQQNLDATLWTCPWNFQRALDATLWTCSWNFQRALDATLWTCSWNFQHTLDATLWTCSWNFQQALDATLWTCCWNFPLQMLQGYDKLSHVIGDVLALFLGSFFATGSI